MTTSQSTVVVKSDEEGFNSYVPTLPGCHSFGETVDEARRNIAESIELHVESMAADGETVSLQ